MSFTPTPLTEKLFKYLYPAETFFLGLLTVGILLPKFDIDSSGIIMISLSGLAVIFFLYAYRPLEVKIGQGDKMGFKELIYLTILPKLLWLSASVNAIGVLFFLLDMKGYKEMLMIGSATSLVALVIIGIFFLTEEKHIKATIPILYRVVPLLLVAAYVLFN